MPPITLTTDFHHGSTYVAAMKAVILTINPAATIVDVTHDVPPQDVRRGARVLDEVTALFPADTIHVAVIDPGVGTDRGIVYVRIGRQQYVCPDNGLLALMARRTPPSQIIRLTEPGYWLQPVSATFHGRDIMAPVAARLSLGLEPSLLGETQAGLLMLDWPEPTQSPGRIEGRIEEIDSFGNLISNISELLLAEVPHDHRTTVETCGRKVQGIVRTYGERSPGELVALVGSSGWLELAVVNGNAADDLAAMVGDAVTVTW
jgi:S-adenosylmethionine hydrolase